MKQLTKKNIRLCRPPADATEVMRYDGKKWAPDNGQPGVAFSFRDKAGFPIAATAHDFDWAFARLFGDPRKLTCSRFGCSNGDVLRPIRKKAAP